MSISIQRRGKRWTASVRLNGYTVSGTFDIKYQARTWSERARRDILSAHAEGRKFDPKSLKIIRRKLKPGEMLTPLESVGLTQEEIDADPTPRVDWTLGRALRHYEHTVSDKLNGQRQASARIQAWQRNPLAKKHLSDITAEDIAAWKEARTKAKRTRLEDGTVRVDRVPCAASTIRNDAYRISALYEHARKARTEKTRDVSGWGLTGLTNPVAAVSLPALPEGRQRRLDEGHDDQAGEEERILVALAEGPDAEQMIDILTIAIESGMRRSEVLDLRADEIRSTRLGRVIEREKSKNGSARRIVLSERATTTVDKRRKGKIGRGKLFTLNADAVATRWDIARKKAGCPNLRMHDIRHEAMSRMADAGLSVGALAAQGGYKTFQTLLRYVNASERDIREKLARK